MSDRIDIAMGFDGRYAPHAANVMASIIRHAPGAKLRLILLQSGVSEEIRRRTERTARGADFVWIDVRDEDLPAFTHGHLNRTVLFRLGLEALAPQDCGRVIYVDSDTVVLGDIRELVDVDLKGHALGAVTDCYQDADEFAGAWSLPKGGRYFNSGVLVIDLPKVRGAKLFSKAIDFVARNGERLLFGDQDGLNYAFWMNTAVIEPTWNVQRFLKPEEIASETAPDRRWGHRRPRLIHFIGTEKPWMRNVWHPWAWAYWDSLKRTPFARDVVQTYRMDFAQRMRLRLRWMLRRPA